MHESTNQPDDSAVDSLIELFFEIREHVEKVSARVRMAQATQHPLDVVRARRHMDVGMRRWRRPSTALGEETLVL